MASGRLKGVVFDLDGTVIYSTIDFVKMKQNMIKVLEANDIPEGVLTPRETTVVTLERSEGMWDESGKPEEERVEVRERLDEIMNQGELEAVPLVKEIEGAAKAIRLLREMGYKLAILTRSHHAYAVEALRKIGAHDYFDVILGRGETPRPKPYPEALEHTTELLGLEMDEIVFVGDHHIDAQSASNSGCPFVGVRTGGRHRDPWGGQEPEVLLDSIAVLPEHLKHES
ncbi:MAG: HAD family hydrolase [Candidatus Bathyarchaeota archaeon]|nr:MAG: HAD family hydrolase [Candidatus Bathyarchaeota archaeon]